MEIERIISAAIFGGIAILLFFSSYRQHKEKGFILTNKWIYATKKERAEMDERIKKREYRVARNVFFLLGITSFIFAVNVLVWLVWLVYIIYALMAVLIIYGIAQWITNERYYKSLEDE
jgi:Flp pilus assembly protein TadB